MVLAIHLHKLLGQAGEALWFGVLVAAAVLTLGCGDSDDETTFAFEDVSVSIYSSVDLRVRKESEVGHEVTVWVSHTSAKPGSGCLPTDLAISVNGMAQEGPGADPRCPGISREVRPFVKDQPLSVRLERRGKVATAEFAGVFPGAAVTTSPPGLASVASGGEIALSVPAALAGKVEGPAAFFWLDHGTVFHTWSWSSPRGDTLLVPVPPQGSGRAIVFAGVGVGLASVTVLRCEGLRSCRGDASATLGPLPVLVIPPAPQPATQQAP